MAVREPESTRVRINLDLDASVRMSSHVRLLTRTIPGTTEPLSRWTTEPLDH